MGTSEKVPIFAWIVRERGLPVPLHRSPLQDQLGLQGLVYSLRAARTGGSLYYLAWMLMNSALSLEYMIFWLE